MALSSLVWSLGMVGLVILAYCAVCTVLLLYIELPDEPPLSYLSDAMVLVSLPFILGFTVIVSRVRS